VRFRRWIFRVPRGHVTNGVPACALDRIRQTFAAESNCSFSYPRWWFAAVSGHFASHRLHRGYADYFNTLLAKFAKYVSTDFTWKWR